MSAGHGHRRPNPHHHTECAKLLKTGGAPELMQRWQKLDVDHDIPDLAGYDVSGKVRYLDRDFFRALLDPHFAVSILGHPLDTGMSAEDTVRCIAEHEGEEKVILDADNPIDVYEGAHEIATCGEHERVRQLGGKPYKYERGLKPAVDFCARKHPVLVPKDLACAPYLDEPDANDKRILAQFKALGVEDASKASKANVEYSKSTGKDRCDGCAHWRPDPEQAQYGLARCEIVAGLVRADRWCKSYEEAGDGDKTRQGLESGRPEGQAPPRTGDTGEPEDSGGPAVGGNPIVQPRNPA